MSQKTISRKLGRLWVTLLQLPTKLTRALVGKTAPTERFYSQHGEDYLMRVLFGKTDGYFVDVGAFDGRYISNSYFFEQIGWKGICVEPHPDNFRRCRENRPSSVNVQAACTREYMPEIEFYVEPIGLYSSLNTDEERKVQGKYTGRNLEYPGMKKVTVEGIPLTKILDDANAPHDIDFVSIDVEGAEMDVLEGLDLDKYSVAVFIVEANTDEKIGRVDPFFAQKGYHFSRKVKGNALYCREEALAKELATIPIRCKYANVTHPLGKKYHNQKRRGSPFNLRKFLRLG